MGDLFEDFLGAVPPEMQPIVLEINDFLTQKGCKREIKEAKNGHVVSYKRQENETEVYNRLFNKILYNACQKFIKSLDL